MNAQTALDDSDNYGDMFVPTVKIWSSHFCINPDCLFMASISELLKPDMHSLANFLGTSVQLLLKENVESANHIAVPQSI